MLIFQCSLLYYNIYITAILGKMSEPIVSKNWAKFTMNVQSVYKRGQTSRLRRGPATLWIHDNDLKCKCPKIKPGRYNNTFALIVIDIIISLGCVYTVCRCKFVILSLFCFRIRTGFTWYWARRTTANGATDWCWRRGP